MRATRALNTTLLLAAMASVVACVPSLNPLYTDADLVLDEAILGSWVDDEDASWLFEQATEKSYLLTHHPKEVFGLLASEEPGKPVRFEAHLVRLGDDLFLDLYPDSHPSADDLGNHLVVAHLVPAHTFSRIWIDETGVKIGMLDPDWLDEALAARDIEIAHQRGEEGILLTATTPELQAFARSFADDAKAY